MSKRVNAHARVSDARASKGAKYVGKYMFIETEHSRGIRAGKLPVREQDGDWCKRAKTFGDNALPGHSTCGTCLRNDVIVTDATVRAVWCVRRTCYTEQVTLRFRFDVATVPPPRMLVGQHQQPFEGTQALGFTVNGSRIRLCAVPLPDAL